MSLVTVVVGRLPTSGVEVKKVNVYYSALLFTFDEYLDIIDIEVRHYRSVVTIALMVYCITFRRART